MIDALRPMMRLVVTNGTAKEIAGCGEVFGKTGEPGMRSAREFGFAGLTEHLSLIHICRCRPCLSCRYG